MSYWERAPRPQLELVAAFCRGKQVIDFGGWDGSLGVFLLEQGARSVLNVDKENPYLSKSHVGLSKASYTFAEFNVLYPQDSWQVGVLSWPANNDYAMGQLLPLLPRCQEVVYLGKNAGGTQTGTPLLWRYLITRRLIHSRIERTTDALFYSQAARGEEPVSETEEMGLFIEETPALG